MLSHKIEILLVEDNSGDIDLVKETLADKMEDINLNFAKDGEEALDYLLQKKDYKNSIRPDLILLDLNLPRKDGRELLLEIKSTENLKTIPVIVLTTSDAEKDIREAYRYGASCFISKPIGIEKFTTIMETLSNFWFSSVKFPPRSVSDKIESMDFKIR